MKRNFLPIAMTVISLLVFFNFSWAQCPQDPTDLGTCDTLYVETFDCDHVYDATGSHDSVRVAIYVTHDSNTFWWDGAGYWVQDSITGFHLPLKWSKLGCADSVVLPTYGNWNNKATNRASATFKRSMFRDLVNPHTGVTDSNRYTYMMSDLGYEDAWSVNVNFKKPDSAMISMLAPGFGKWWEGKKVLLATLTFLVYQSGSCDSTGICLDSTFWPPGTNLAFTRYDAVNYVPRHFLPVCEWVGPPRLEVISPDGGEIWAVGDIHYITWLSPHFIGDSVKLEFSTNAGSSWMPVINKTPNDGEHPWVIPNNLSALCRVRVSDAVDGVPADTSDSNFTISNPAITVTDPDGGESFMIGSPMNITWTWIGSFTNVKIELSRDGGSNWGILIASTSNDGSWNWPSVTGPASTTCKVKISDTVDGVPADTSNANFTIASEPDFSIDATPDTQYVQQGESTSYDVTLTSLNGFASSCTLTVTGLPSLATGEFNPRTVVPTGASVLKIHTNIATPVGTCTLTVTGTEIVKGKNGLQDSVKVILIVTLPPPDFTLDAIPETLKVTKGDSGAYTVDLDTIYGVNPPCTLSVTGLPTGAKGVFVPKIVAPPGSSILAINTYADSIAVGPYELVITGKRGSLIHSDSVIFIVEPCTSLVHFAFTETGSSYTINVDSAFLYQLGLEDCDEIGVFDDTGGGLLCVGASVYNSSKAPLVLLAWKDDPNPGINGYIEGDSMHFKIWSKEQNKEEIAEPHYSQGDGNFGAPGGTSTLWLEAPPSDFTIAVIPETLTILAGRDSSYHVTLTSINGFASNCTLTVSGLPAWYGATFNPDTVRPTGTSELTISVPDTAWTGTFFLTIKATELGKAKSLEHSKIVKLTVAWPPTGMKIAGVIPDTEWVTAGQSTFYDVIVRYFGAFSLPCTLSVSGLPAGASGSFNPNPAGPPPPTDDTSRLTIIATCDTGTYELTIRGRCTSLLDRLVDSAKVMLFVLPVTGVDDGGDPPNAPDKFALFQNQPNPFNPETEISYYLPEGCEVKLTIYNILGRRIRTLFDGYQNVGTNTIIWDGKDDQGNQVSSGIYFYRLQAGEFNQTRKMNLLK